MPSHFPLTMPDFDVLADQLAGIKGRFLMSINDTPEIRDIFAGFTVGSADTAYSLQGGGASKKVTELIISNA